MAAGSCAGEQLWIALKQNLEESLIFHGKIDGFR
jgi:hypothetical protein